MNPSTLMQPLWTLRSKATHFLPHRSADLDRICAFLDSVFRTAERWHHEVEASNRAPDGRWKDWREKTKVRCWAAAGTSYNKTQAQGWRVLEPKSLLSELGLHASASSSRTTGGRSLRSTSKTGHLEDPVDLLDLIEAQDKGLVTALQNLDREKIKKALGRAGDLSRRVTPRPERLEWGDVTKCTQALRRVTEMLRAFALLAQFPDEYAVHFEPTTPWSNNESTSCGFGSSAMNPGRFTLHILLLRPAVVFRPLAKAAHGLVLASGTLCPINGLFAELGREFLARQLRGKDCPGILGVPLSPLDAGHVIDRSQLFLQRISKTSAKGSDFSSVRNTIMKANGAFAYGGGNKAAGGNNNFYVRSGMLPVGGAQQAGGFGGFAGGSSAQQWNDELLADLGLSVLALARSIPAGLLVFFASYAHLEHCLELWTATGTVNALEQVKGKIVVEDRRRDVQEMKSEYQEAVERTGQALLFAVMRGKCSEGLSFNDNFARGIVILGICLPAFGEAAVVHKMAYNTHFGGSRSASTRATQAKKNASSAATSSRFFSRTAAESGTRELENSAISTMLLDRAGLASGNAWYEQQALRAINQALGRCIRHQGDYGALFLFDTRWTTRAGSFTNKLATWMRNLGVRPVLPWPQLQMDLANFFNANRNRARVDLML
ncbi:unnamed protein product [Amoebophrya sp. A25]|nr:unnamed protein product [Amoebophrya sp. A25]|eukprot:GSA25T00014130001.1